MNMKLLVPSLFIVLTLVSCVSSPKGGKLPQYGMASWYGDGLHGNKTANGERFDMHELTAAHRTLPFGTIVCVKSAATQREVVVRINDRGPFAKGRIIDISKEAARQLGMLTKGEEKVSLHASRCP